MKLASMRDDQDDQDTPRKAPRKGPTGQAPRPPMTAPSAPSDPPPRPRKQREWPDLCRTYEGLSSARDWFAEGIIEGKPIGMLIGPEKREKSWSLMDLAVAVASKGKWLGTFPAMKMGKVCYVDLEYGRPEFVRRVVRICRGRNIEPTKVLRSIQYCDDRRLTLCGDLLRRPEKALSEREKAMRQPFVDLFGALADDPPALIILDPLRNALPGNENDSDVATAAFLALDALRDRYQCPVICAHHLNKAGGYSGSRALLTRADLIIEGSDEEQVWYGVRSRTMRRTDRAATRYTVRVTHENDENDTIAATTLSARFEGERHASASLSKPAKRVLAELEGRHASASNRQLRDALRMSSQAVGRALAELEAEGRVEQTDGGKWEVGLTGLFPGSEGDK